MVDQFRAFSSEHLPNGVSLADIHLVKASRWIDLFPPAH
jgi:hypothetical protein